MLDPTALAKKHATGEIQDADITAMIADLRHYQTVAAYLASCHAATLESLPKSASKSARNRLVGLCDAAANLIEQEATPDFRTTITDAAARCRNAKTCD